MSEFRLINTNGGVALLLGKYKYHKHKNYADGSDKQIHAFGKLHTCEPNVHKNDALKIMHELRKTVITSDEPIPKLYNDATNSFKETGLELVIPIPSLNNSTSFLYGARNKTLDLKKTVYKSVSEIEIPLKFRDQILADYCDKDEKVLVFFQDTQMLYEQYHDVNVCSVDVNPSTSQTVQNKKEVGIQSDNYNWGKDNNVSTQTPEMANEASLQEANRKFGELIGQELNNVPVVKRRQIMFEIIRIIELRTS